MHHYIYILHHIYIKSQHIHNLSKESRDSERLFGWVPLFHNLGLVYLIFIPALDKEFSVGIMSPNAFLEKPSRWFEAMSDFKADSTLAPNSVYESYPKLVPANKLKGINLSNVRTFLNGSELVNYSTISFSVVKEGKEKLIIIPEISGKIANDSNLNELVEKINSCVSKYFEISPYHVGFIKEGTLPRSDNGN